MEEALEGRPSPRAIMAEGPAKAKAQRWGCALHLLRSSKEAGLARTGWGKRRGTGRGSGW